MRTSALLLVAACFLLVATTAKAQRDAASKIDGVAYEAPYFYDTADMYQQNAYSHAVVLQNATASNVPVPQAITKEHTDAIRANLKAAQKHQTSLRAAHSDNKSAAKHFDAIDTHHKKALAAADEIDKSAMSGKGDAAAVNKSAAKLANELKSAHDTHKTLADTLNGKK